ncbi:MAG: glycerophosphodiester phosphodiesterase [Lentisphaeria bacterium]|nr:glycerophosphodiester phosphodiesterase [Lentisphaeria bacterium]
MPSSPMIVAHRGASRDAPENTLASFTLGWREGADAIEGDFRLTKDGRIACIHDPDTQRVAGERLIVAESTLAELRSLDVGACRGDEYRGCLIPTLAQVLATVPEQKKIYVEIKCGNEIIPKLLDEIKESRLTPDQAVFISFNAQLLKEIKRQAPKHKVFWLVDIRKDKAGHLSPPPGTVLATLNRIHADGLSTSAGGVDKGFVDQIVAEGYEWHVWTVDDPKTAKRMAEMGARSITTNVPGIIGK